MDSGRRVWRCRLLSRNIERNQKKQTTHQSLLKIEVQSLLGTGERERESQRSCGNSVIISVMNAGLSKQSQAPMLSSTKKLRARQKFYCFAPLRCIDLLLRVKYRQI